MQARDIRRRERVELLAFLPEYSAPLVRVRVEMRGRQRGFILQGGTQTDLPLQSTTNKLGSRKHGPRTRLTYLDPEFVVGVDRGGEEQQVAGLLRRLEPLREPCDDLCGRVWHSEVRGRRGRRRRCSSLAGADLGREKEGRGRCASTYKPVEGVRGVGRKDSSYRWAGGGKHARQHHRWRGQATSQAMTHTRGHRQSKIGSIW